MLASIWVQWRKLVKQSSWKWLQQTHIILSETFTGPQWFRERKFIHCSLIFGSFGRKWSLVDSSLLTLQPKTKQVCLSAIVETHCCTAASPLIFSVSSASSGAGTCNHNVPPHLVQDWWGTDYVMMPPWSQTARSGLRLFPSSLKAEKLRDDVYCLLFSWFVL